MRPVLRFKCLSQEYLLIGAFSELVDVRLVPFEETTRLFRRGSLYNYFTDLLLLLQNALMQSEEQFI
jgi:hypothetical protein